MKFRSSKYTEVRIVKPIVTVILECSHKIPFPSISYYNKKDQSKEPQKKKKTPRFNRTGLPVQMRIRRTE